MVVLSNKRQLLCGSGAGPDLEGSCFLNLSVVSQEGANGPSYCVIFVKYVPSTGSELNLDTA